MANQSKTFRIGANPGQDTNIKVQLDQEYDTLEILSMKLDQRNEFVLHSSNYGIVAGRVMANGGFGVPNAKVSIFVEADSSTLADPVLANIYPFLDTFSRNSRNARYNLLPDYEVKGCHQAVGNIPSKQYILDNDIVLDVFDKYYSLTARTNESGDYMITNVPVGQHTVHMDVDLSDCGVLSQRPRDFLYKGYNIEQFENPNKFKKSPEIDKLSQVFSQDQVVNVIPFWGNEGVSGEIGITRADLDVNFKFEPTCVFMGSVVGDNKSNGISRKCIPTDNMGAMDELVSGEGTIEMIRKTRDGSVEEFQVKGTELIDTNGVWCYQIPMNLDYVVTDEYGNIVPSNDPDKGIPTRARVRFRISMQDMAGNNDRYFRSKVLVPHNPSVSESEDGSEDEIDYNFGTSTKEHSFRDLYWDNIYTVKSYIPRFQKNRGVKYERFTGIKHCNIYGQNNPMPYNNIRIRFPFMFTIMCALIKTYIRVVGFTNNVIRVFTKVIGLIGRNSIADLKPSYVVLGDGLCPELENWYFAPKGVPTDYTVTGRNNDINLFKNTFRNIKDENGYGEIVDKQSIDKINSEQSSETICLTNNVDYLVSCIEMNLAQEYKVINFDFYNDWINGVLYFPRWAREKRRKRKYLFGLIKVKEKIKGCMNDESIFGRTRYYTQQCSLEYGIDNSTGTYTRVMTSPGCSGTGSGPERCHKKSGMEKYGIFGRQGGIVNETETMLGQHVYYFKPCEFRNGKKVNLFATDLVLLGSLKENNEYGIPQAFNELSSTSFKIPTNLALTNMEDTAYLYTNGTGGTICSETEYKEDESVSSNKGNLSFSDVERITKGTSDEAKYSDLDDAIPVTEASGIAWNYAGPGQGENDKKTLYYPGGLFLGLSCVNSQTNIKSCINLQRVCEQGAEISHRKEIIGSFKTDGENKVPERYYLVPNGLIAKDEISSPSFRSMFATLNKKKLFADSVSPETGYPIYSFEYSRPDGFGGNLARRVTNESYLKRIEVKDDLSGTTLNLDESDDYDKNEKDRTFMRVIEDPNVDYYTFRLGIPYGYDSESIKTSGKMKFLNYSRNGRVSLPQYENSFYFYFGIREGSTALDELKKQFFSHCEDPVYASDMFQINVFTDGGDLCTMKSKMNVTILNGTAPYRVTLKKDGTQRGEKEIDGNFCHFEDIDEGRYTVSAQDSNGEIINQEIECRMEGISFEYNLRDFTEDISARNIDEILNDDRSLIDGYLKTDGNVSIKGETFNIFDERLTSGATYDVCFLISDNKKDGGCYDYASTDEDIVDKLPGISGKTRKDKIIDETNKRVLLWGSPMDYSIYLGIKCKKNGSDYNFTKISTVKSVGVKDLNICLGIKELNYRDYLYRLKPEWWKGSYDDPLYEVTGATKSSRSVLSNDDINWAIRHFSTETGNNEKGEYSSNVFAYSESGEDAVMEKFLTGVPENSMEIRKVEGKKVVCNTFNEDGYKGYELSDTGVCFPVYTLKTIEGVETKDEPYSVNFFNDKLIGATEQLGKVTKMTISGDTITLIVDGSMTLIKGKAYMLRVDGELLIPVECTDGGSYKFKNIGSDDIKGGTYGDVKIYPQMEYPIVYNPISLEAYSILFGTYRIENISFEKYTIPQDIDDVFKEIEVIVEENVSSGELRNFFDNRNRMKVYNNILYGDGNFYEKTDHTNYKINDRNLTSRNSNTEAETGTTIEREVFGGSGETKGYCNYVEINDNSKSDDCYDMTFTAGEEKPVDSIIERFFKDTEIDEVNAYSDNRYYEHITYDGAKLYKEYWTSQNCEYYLIPTSGITITNNDNKTIPPVGTDAVDKKTTYLKYPFKEKGIKAYIGKTYEDENEEVFQINEGILSYGSGIKIEEDNAEPSVIVAIIYKGHPIICGFCIVLKSRNQFEIHVSLNYGFALESEPSKIIKAGNGDTWYKIVTNYVNENFKGAIFVKSVSLVVSKKPHYNSVTNFFDFEELLMRGNKNAISEIEKYKIKDWDNPIENSQNKYIIGMNKVTDDESNGRSSVRTIRVYPNYYIKGQ